jgi:hypothetical protein
MTLTKRQLGWIRWARDRARFIVACGLGLYALEFLLDWLWAIDVGGILSRTGLVLGLLGASCGLLWFVDARTPRDASD